MSGGGCGVFGEKRGGWKGATLGGVIIDIWLAVGQYVVNDLALPGAATDNFELRTGLEADDYPLILASLALSKLIFGPGK